jgi:two-component system, chemotaxis family, response regulator Rcp1
MLHVLLVEDNPADVLLVREAIRTSPINADVTIAYDGLQALHLLEKLKFTPDVIVLDLNLPGADGFSVLEQYHPEDKPPVMVLSGSDRSEDKKRAFDLGAKDYVVKPPSFSEFIQTVQTALMRWYSDRQEKA